MRTKGSSELRLIAHRGNLEGPQPSRENHPSYIDEAIGLGFDAEVDLWVEGKDFFLGHDEPKHLIDSEWLRNRQEHLWVHCKNREAIDSVYGTQIHWFFHENDPFTITSRGVIWAFPGKFLLRGQYVYLEFGQGRRDIPANAYGVCGDDIISIQNL